MSVTADAPAAAPYLPDRRDPSVNSCVSCGGAAGTPYCPHCGEQRAADRGYSLRHIATEALATFTNADRRFARTLAILVRRPGALTVAYMRGERVRLVDPLQLFLLVNVAYFVAAGVAGFRTFDTPLSVHLHGTPYRALAEQVVARRLAERHESLATYAPTFDAVSTTQAKSLIIAMVPAFALVVAALAAGRRRFAAQALVFSLHTYAFILVLLAGVGFAATLALTGLHAVGLGIPAQQQDDVVSLATLVVLGFYLRRSLQRAYAFGQLAAIAGTFVLVATIAMLLMAYRLLLLFTTLAAA